MATKSAEQISQPLKYQTWVLKVSMHCEDCKRKVQKVLQSIDGVYKTTIDLQQQKVTVTGNVDIQTIIKKLIKTRKHAALWKNSHWGYENLVEKGEVKLNSTKHTGEGPSKELKNGLKFPAVSPASDGWPAVVHNGGGSEGSGCGGKKNKRKGNNKGGFGPPFVGAPAGSGSQIPGPGVGPISLIPTVQCSNQYTQADFPHTTLYGANSEILRYPTGFTSKLLDDCHLFRTVCPNLNLRIQTDCPVPRQVKISPYSVPTIPYTYADTHQTIYPVQSIPSKTFEILSDENANGCHIM